MTPAPTNPLTPPDLSPTSQSPCRKAQTSSVPGFNPVGAANSPQEKQQLGDSFTLHEETCWEQVGPVAVPGLQEDFWDVSGWLTAPWACSSPQCPSVPLVGFAHVTSCKGVQQMLFVASSVPAAPGLGRVSPAVKGGDSPFCCALVRCKCCI